METGEDIITSNICVDCITLAMCMNKEHEKVASCAIFRKTIRNTYVNLKSKGESAIIHFEGLDRTILVETINDLLLISCVDEEGNFLM